MKRENILFYLGILPALFFQLIGAFLYFKLFTESTPIIYSVTKILIVVWPITWWFLIKKIFPKEKKAENIQSILLGIISGLIISGLVLLIFYFFGHYFQQFAPLVSQKAFELGIINHYLLFAIFLSLIHSLIEEYYWRWFVFKGLQLKFKPVLAAIIGSFAFASHHFIVISEFFPLSLTIIFGTAVMIGGILWCWLYNKTKTLLGSWISHVLIDMSIMIIGYFLIFK